MKYVFQNGAATSETCAREKEDLRVTKCGPSVISFHCDSFFFFFEGTLRFSGIAEINWVEFKRVHRDKYNWSFRTRRQTGPETIDNNAIDATEFIPSKIEIVGRNYRSLRSDPLCAKIDEFNRRSIWTVIFQRPVSPTTDNVTINAIETSCEEISIRRRLFSDIVQVFKNTHFAEESSSDRYFLHRLKRTALT